MSTPTLFMRYGPMLAWLREHGITEHAVRTAIGLGSLQQHRPFNPKGKALYRRDEVARAFGLPDPSQPPPSA